MTDLSELGLFLAGMGVVALMLLQLIVGWA